MSTVIVTGDSRGLGATIAEWLLDSMEYRVIGLSRGNPPEFLAEKYEDRFAHYSFDLSEPAAVPDLYRNELKQQGPIHGLVNNAAVAYDDIVTNADVDVLSRTFDVNVVAPIMLSKYAIRDMLLNRHSGSLVHVSSVSTSTGYKGLSMYAATKAALEGFSRGVAREWGERDIRSNCVAPGFMETEMTEGLTESERARIYQRTSLGEETDPESVAAAVAFLLSDESRSITGEVIRSDAGTL